MICDWAYLKRPLCYYSMPTEIRLPQAKVGYAGAHGRSGESLPVILREFTSSEDGNLFIGRLEGIPRQILSYLPGGGFHLEPCVHHLFAIIRADGATTVYLNDLPYTMLARTKRAIDAGADVTLDHILDISKLQLKGVTVPRDAGVVVILSAGWRKGLFFDFTPLHRPNEPRAYDLESTLGQYYTYLHFQHLFSMTDAVWEEFFRQGWFPFIHLPHETLRLMVAWAGAGFSLDDQLDVIVPAVTATVAAQIEGWRRHPLFLAHHSLIATAFQRFTAHDYVSAIAILLPRIEGILRANHYADPAAPRASQENLVASAFARAQLPAHAFSLLLPLRFQRYLEEIYFAAFEPRRPNALNRNTVAHGVAPTETFDRKGATLGFLILLQLVALLPQSSRTAES